MNRPDNALRPVKSLSPETARKIAAGEVIDRPQAVVRELLDNAADAGADSIQVEIDGGGIERIRVADNGFGMTKEDLENCAKPHATSKIANETDLLSLATLGFRGEALASIAAVSRLEITSFRSGLAWKLDADISGKHRLTPANLAKGTVVQSCGLFENFPARRVFLKRPASEALLCKQVFVEKALPLPQTAFRLTMDSKIKLDLPAEQSLAERFTSALDLAEPAALFYEIKADYTDAGFSLVCLLGEPSVRRADKKNMFVYINGRRIWEYGLVQAIEYGGQGYFPNGTYPVACLFVTMDPSLVDFNIHPAKKEARFKDMGSLHRAVSSTVREFYKNHSAANLASLIGSGETAENTDLFSSGSISLSDAGPQSPSFSAPHTGKSGAAGAAGKYRFSASFGEKGHAYERSAPYSAPSSRLATSAPQTPPPEAFSRPETTPPAEEKTGTPPGGDFRFVGSALGVFIIVEKDETLYLIDQHAAQERLAYDRFLASAGEKQPLLFPYVIETSSETDDAYLETIQDELEKTGISLKNVGGGRWEASSVPVKWIGTEEDLAADLLVKRVKPAELCAALAATSACRAAVKDGTILDPETARDLAARTLALSDPHCPHGRPVWTTIAKSELFKLVRRSE